MSKRLSSHIKQSSQRLRYVAEIYLQNICGMSSIGIKFTYFEIRFEMQRKFFKTQHPCCKRSLHQANLDSPSPRPITAFGKKKMRKAIRTIYNWTIIKSDLLILILNWALPDCSSVTIYHNGACLLTWDVDYKLSSWCLSWGNLFQTWDLEYTRLLPGHPSEGIHPQECRGSIPLLRLKVFRSLEIMMVIMRMIMRLMKIMEMMVIDKENEVTDLWMKTKAIEAALSVLEPKETMRTCPTNHNYSHYLNFLVLFVFNDDYLILIIFWLSPNHNYLHALIILSRSSS